jgi:cytochrome c556
MSRLTATLAAIGLAAVIVYPLVLHGQTSDHAVNAITAQPKPQPAHGTIVRGAATLASDEQDAVILARQGFMEGIYQYMDDAEDWMGQADSDMPQALMREAAHLALMLSSFKQLFPPSTNPESPEFSASLETYALPTIWAEPALFSAKLDETVAAINALSMAPGRPEYARRLQALQATCDACHDHFRRVYVSPLDPK